jgi:hypothetical protein
MAAQPVKNERRASAPAGNRPGGAQFRRFGGEIKKGSYYSNSTPMLPKALSSPADLEQTKGRRWKPSLTSGSQHIAMLRQVDNITAAELRGYFLQELPKLTDLERARCERYIETLAAFERGERNSTHPASTTLQ